MPDLEELDALLRVFLDDVLARNPAFRSRVRPGRAPEEVAERLSQAGVPVYEEAVVWWSHHDGVEGDANAGGGFDLTSLDDALARRTDERTWPLEYGLPVEDLWSSAWLPIAVHSASRPVIVLDRRDDTDQVLLIQRELDDLEPKAASLAEVLTRWIAWHRSGFVVPTSDGSWDVDWDEVTPPFTTDVLI